MKNYSLYGLPDKVKFCKLCVISNQRPSSVVEFRNKNNLKTGIKMKSGICDACNYNSKKNFIDWKKREDLLNKILSKYRKSNGKYDCIVPSSGGKDSSFTAHLLKTKYGMNPLTVTWSPMMWTDEGFENFQNLSKIGGIDSVLHTPRGDLHRYLTQQAFLNLCHPFQPFIHGQKIIGPKYAYLMDINLVIYGENQAEYGNNIEENYKETMEKKFYSDHSENIFFGGVSKKEIIKTYKFKNEDFLPYEPLNNVKQNDKIQVHYLGYYLRWDPQECYYYAAENTGFKTNTERTEGSYSKYSSIDDKIDPFHYYTTLIKFGIGRATYDSSQEIRNNKISREEGVNLVKLFDHEFPKKYFKDFLNYIDLSEELFFETIDKFRSPHLWTKDSNNNWKLRHNVYKTGTDDIN